MSRKATTAGIFVLSIALGAATASAATVTVSGGTVSMNTGSGWSQVTGSTTAMVGSKVMAAKDSEGQIVYADGCFERVKAGVVKTVKAVSPCVNRSGAGLKDEVVATADPHAGLGFDPTFLIAAAVVGGVIAVVASNNDDDDDAAASP